MKLAVRFAERGKLAVRFAEHGNKFKFVIPVVTERHTRGCPQAASVIDAFCADGGLRVTASAPADDDEKDERRGRVFVSKSLRFPTA